MILLSGSVSRPFGSRVMGDRKDLGMLIGPSAWRSPWCDNWACDNDVFAHRSDPNWWQTSGETAWLKMLDKAAVAVEQGNRPLFCVLPDVVGDWSATITRAWYYLPELRQRNLPVALALQDGLPIEQTLNAATMLYPDFFFVGGTTAWKWANAERVVSYGHAIGVRVHIGRASGPNRVRECVRIGADSCDGSKFFAFSEQYLPGVLRAKDGAESQLRLSLFGASLFGATVSDWRMA